MSRWYAMVFAVLLAGLAVGCDGTETETDEVLPEPDTTAAPIHDGDGDAGVLEDGDVLPDADLADPEPGDAPLVDPSNAVTDPESVDPQPANPNLATPPQTEPQDQDGANAADVSSDEPVDEEPVDSLPEQSQDGSE